MSVTEEYTLDETVVSLHRLGRTDDGEIIDLDGGIFDNQQYSAFKYGDLSVASRYARRLTRQIASEHGDELRGAYVSSSAYKHVPTAAAIITELALAELPMLGYEPAGLVRVDRGVVLTTDYAKMSQEEREVAMKHNELEISSASASAVKGRNVLVIDDIRITGSHERALACQLGKAGVRSVIFGYVAIMDPEVSRIFPQVENEINGALVKTALDLISVIQSGNFGLNARTCKFILQEHPERVRELFSSIPLESARTIISAMVADGYHTNPAFVGNFEIIKNATTVRSKSLRDNPQVLRTVLDVMQREKQDEPVTDGLLKRGATQLSRVVLRRVDDYVDRRQQQIAAEREVLHREAESALERYDAKVSEFVMGVEKLGSMVKIKFDEHGLIDRSWIVPCRDKNTYIAVSLRREMEEELYSARAVLMQLPTQITGGLKYKGLFDFKQFVDPKDIEGSLSSILKSSLLMFPSEGYSTFDIAAAKEDGQHFTPMVGLLWSVFPDLEWAQEVPKRPTNSQYFRFKDGSVITPPLDETI